MRTCNRQHASRSYILVKLVDSECVCTRTTKFGSKISSDITVINLQMSMTEYIALQYSVTFRFLWMTSNAQSTSLSLSQHDKTSPSFSLFASAKDRQLPCFSFDGVVRVNVFATISLSLTVRAGLTIRGPHTNPTNVRPGPFSRTRSQDF